MAEVLVLASGNAGKLAELVDLLPAERWQLRSQADFGLEGAEETGLTFIENALLKARHVCEQTGHASLADDSGLVVPALNGAPGLYSARFAGEGANDAGNNQLLLQRMNDLSGEERTAYFFCAIVYLAHKDDPAPLIGIGRWHGQVLQTPEGSGGFGYDPIFRPAGESCSAAELPPDIKSRISHRGQALAMLLAQLK